MMAVANDRPAARRGRRLVDKRRGYRRDKPNIAAQGQNLETFRHERWSQPIAQDVLDRLRARGTQTFRFPKVHPAEISKDWVKTLGFSPAGEHLLYAARAQSA